MMTETRTRMPAPPPLLSPRLNPTGLTASAGAIYAATLMIYDAVHHHGVISVPVVIAAVFAVASLFTRTIVTPVAAPRDGNGNPLVPADAHSSGGPSENGDRAQ
jgi:hypothetical protein